MQQEIAKEKKDAKHARKNERKRKKREKEKKKSERKNKNNERKSGKKRNESGKHSGRAHLGTEEGREVKAEAGAGARAGLDGDSCNK